MPNIHAVRRVILSRPRAPVVAGAYSAVAVTFDGTNDYFDSQAITTSDSKTFTLSVWVKFTVGGDASTLSLIRRDGSGGVQITRRNDGVLIIQATNTAGSTILDMESNTANPINSSDGWVHILLSVNHAAHAQLYINDASDSPNVWTRTDDTIDHTDGTVLFATNAAAELYNGDIAEFYYNTAVALDLSVESNRRKFIDASGKPVDLGSDGSTPTASAPAVFLSGALASWHTNKGGGGGFTLNGTLDTAATSPSD